MPQSFACLHVHFVFSTKGRQDWITPAVAERLYPYIDGIIKTFGSKLIQAGGMPDHIHLLVSLGREIAIADAMRIVKSNSSGWIHETFPELATFAWQAGYGAFAVSASQVKRVVNYITNQAKHHRDRSFQDEYQILLQKHGIEWDEQYVWD